MGIKIKTEGVYHFRVSCDKCGNSFDSNEPTINYLKKDIYLHSYFIAGDDVLCSECWEIMQSVLEAKEQYPDSYNYQEAYYAGRTKPFTDLQVLAAAKAGREEDAKSHCTAGDMLPWDKTKTSSRNHWLKLANVMLQAAADELK